MDRSNRNNWDDRNNRTDWMDRSNGNDGDNRNNRNNRTNRIYGSYRRWSNILNLSHGNSEYTYRVNRYHLGGKFKCDGAGCHIISDIIYSKHRSIIWFCSRICVCHLALWDNALQLCRLQRSEPRKSNCSEFLCRGGRTGYIGRAWCDRTYRIYRPDWKNRPYRYNRSHRFYRDNRFHGNHRNYRTSRDIHRYHRNINRDQHQLEPVCPGRDIHRHRDLSWRRRRNRSGIPTDHNRKHHDILFIAKHFKLVCDADLNHNGHTLFKPARRSKYHLRVLCHPSLWFIHRQFC